MYKNCIQRPKRWKKLQKGGKKVEKAALQTIKNENVENTAALANPESLEYFSNLREELKQ